MYKRFFKVFFLIFLFPTITIAQDSDITCPPLYNHSIIRIPNIQITKFEVVDSNKFTSLPQFIMNKDSIADLIVYPEIAKRAGVQGNVVIKIILDERGKIKEWNFVKAIGAACDEAALDELRKSKFYAAKIGNEKVSSEIYVWFEFNLIEFIDKPDVVLSEIIYEDNSLYNYKKLTLDKLGNANYVELDKTAEPGHEIKTEKKGKIQIDRYERLSDFIVSQCFLKFNQPHYSSTSPHSRWETITVKSDIGKKRISSTGRDGDPVGLWAIIYILSHIQDQIKWEVVKE